MNFKYKSTECICIDTLKMEYMENGNDIFGIC